MLYPDETGGNWRIQAVPIAPESFESRKALPEQWRGVRDDALSQLSGVDGCIFVHASGFIGGELLSRRGMEGLLKRDVPYRQQDQGRRLAPREPRSQHLNVFSDCEPRKVPTSVVILVTTCYGCQRSCMISTRHTQWR